MKTKITSGKKRIAIAAMCVFLGGQLMAQSWSTTGNAGIAAGTNYLGTSDPNDLVFRSNAIERGRLLGTGEWRFGGTTNYVSIDGAGRLRFNGTGVYQVGSNRYAFQLSADPNYGLFFNTTLGQYEFRDGTASSVFAVAGTGNAVLKGTLKIGAYTLPATDGAVNQVLKTNGAGVLAWSADNNSNSGWGLTGNSGTSSATNYIGTTDAVALVTRTNSVERMRLLVDGKLGVGTNSPNARLHVNSATGEDGFRVQIAGSTRFLINQAGGASIGSSTEGPADGLYVNGNVGIGVSAPTSKLQVAGDLNFDGDGSGIIFDGGQTIRDQSGVGFLDIRVHGDLVPDATGSHALGSSTNEWTEVWAVDGSINLMSNKTTKNVKPLSYGINEIMKLRPVSYNRINNPEGGDGVKRLGLIAEELKAVVPEAVKDYRYNEDQTSKKITKVPISDLGVNMDNIVPVLIKAIQELQLQIEDLKKGTANSSVAAVNESSAVAQPVNIDASLDQNAPNPFNTSTVIRYRVPSSAAKAQIIVSNTAGNTVKAFTITAKGAGSVSINGGELSAGSYYYTLIIDGKKADSKQMILVK